MFKKLIASHQMRRRVSLIIAAVLVLPFILFFHATGQTPTSGPGGSAGILFGKRIPWETFQSQRLWLQRQWEHQFGDLPQAMEAMLTSSTWDRLILLEEAKRQGLRVDDAELASTIEQISAFQDQGRFQPDRYRRYLQIMNTDPRTFESLLRNDLLVEKLVTAERNAVAVSEEDVRAAYTDAHEQLRAVVFLFETSAWTEAIAPQLTEEELRAFFQAHQEAYRVPEQLTIEYAGASRQELLSKVQLNDEELQTFYQDHQSDFADDDKTTKPFDEVKETARQRLAEERVRKQLTALALDLEEDLDARLRFEEIVTGRALRLRTAGPIPANSPHLPGGPEPAVVQAVRSLPEGQLSSVIRTDDGVSVARVTTRVPSRLPAYEEVREPVRQQLIQERAQAAARAAAEELRSRLLTRMNAGMRFEEAVLAEPSSLPVHSSTFTRTGPVAPIGHVPAINEAAFRTALGQLTELASIPSGFIFLRPEARIPADFAEFAKTEGALRQETLGKKQSARLEAWLQQVRERAKLKSLVDASTSEPSS